jgi:hypothetical protein
MCVVLVRKFKFEVKFELVGQHVVIVEMRARTRASPSSMEQ